MNWVVDHRTTCVVTGGSSGIGRETAAGLAQRGASVTFLARDPERTPRVAAELRQETKNDRIDSVVVDFSSLAEVRRAAEEIVERHDRIDVLINNAGVWHPRRKRSRDGFDDTFAVNHLAHFLLTNTLTASIRPPARIIHVSSRHHQLPRSLPIEELITGPKRDLFGFLTYGRSKLCNLLFSLELSRRLPQGVVSHAVHPGDVKTGVARDTWLTRTGMKLITHWLLTPAQGASHTLSVATAPQLQSDSGRYFAESREKEPSPLARDVFLGEQLWSLSDKLTAPWRH